MKIKFDLGTQAGSVTIQREKDDPKAKASGFTKNVHGWGAEIHLLHLLKMKLIAAGFQLACVQVQKDGHLYGDQHMKFLRTPIRHNADAPHLWIVDGNYAVRESAEEYNKYQEVCLNVQGDIFTNKGEPSKQADWYKKVSELCIKSGIECKLSSWCLPAPYQSIDVLANYHVEANTWTVGAYGCVDRNSNDDAEQIGESLEADSESDAIDTAEMLINTLLRDNQAPHGVVIVNGNEHVSLDVSLDIDDHPRIVRSTVESQLRRMS